MNIYFDIDGVLKDSPSPRSDVEKLVLYCLDKYPDSVFWLTTHCRRGINDTYMALAGVFTDELLQKIEDSFKPTDWDVLKTEAIDFSQPFVWFDDTVFEAEINVMNRNMPADALYGLFLFEKSEEDSAAAALDYLKRAGKMYPDR